MSTTVSERQTIPSDGDLAKSPDPKDWRRQLIGLIAGLLLAAIVYFIFPEGAPETVAQSTGAKEEPNIPPRPCALSRPPPFSWACGG